MFDLEKIVKDFAKKNNIELNSFVLSRIRDLQRKEKSMSDEQIVDAIGSEEKFYLILKDRNTRKDFIEFIKKARR